MKVEEFIKIEESYEVVIIGGGSAGCGAAYALIDSCLNNNNFKVLLIDSQHVLGGTSTNAWVSCFAATPDAPYQEIFFTDLLKENKAKYVDENYLDVKIENLQYKDSLFHKQFKHSDNNIELSISVSPSDLAEKYEKDLSHVKNLTIAKRCTFEKVIKVTDGCVNEICVKIDGIFLPIKSKCFIDASGDDVLLRSALSPAIEGIDYFIGSDSSDRYYETHGFKEKNAGCISQRINVNLPTLMYRLENGLDDRTEKPLFGEDAMLYNTPDNKYVYVNSVSLLSDSESGVWVIDKGLEYVRNIFAPRIPYHWKSIKYSHCKKFMSWNLENKKLSSIAPMLGVRETYRANCERILNENMLSKSFIDYKSEKDNLNKIIAIGNHPVDIHHSQEAKTTIQVTPYGVPYGCMIPKKLKNVLIASRGAGFTHIAAASFRLNKDMSQLGWAAGKSASRFVNNCLCDFRNIEVQDLWEDMGFLKTIDKLKTALGINNDDKNMGKISL